MPFTGYDSTVEKVPIGGAHGASCFGANITLTVVKHTFTTGGCGKI